MKKKDPEDNYLCKYCGLWITVPKGLIPLHAGNNDCVTQAKNFEFHDYWIPCNDKGKPFLKIAR